MSAHFSTPATGRGDLGDLAAKESSLETVLCLVGMLVSSPTPSVHIPKCAADPTRKGGTLLIPYLTTLWLTYSVLFILLVMHLVANYFAVRGIAFRTLNRQRTTIAWTAYRQSNTQAVLSPAQVATSERLLEWPGTLRDGRTRRAIGCCTVGSSLSAVRRTPLPAALLSLFASERYILCPEERTPRRVSGFCRSTGPRLHICLKEGYETADLLKAWVHAVEVGLMWSDFTSSSSSSSTAEEGSDIIPIAYHVTAQHLSSFVDGMRQAGWDTDGRGIMAGVPRTLLISVQDEEGFTLSTNGDSAMEARKKV